ncbi:hypothetical protein M378DRAFT_52565, partial [Amanita muscaria Koide BX008]
SAERVRKLAEQWKHVRYLIIDEYSMISRELLATLSKTLSIFFKHLDREEHDLPFGGVNKRSALYFPTSLEDTAQQNAGSELYCQFTTEQMRIQDPEWQHVLQRARHGKCMEVDLNLLRQYAFLVTPRNAVRRKWNVAASRHHCKRTHCQLLKCPSEDRKRGGEPLSPAERLALLKCKFETKTSSEDRTALEEEILLAQGMKVMLVTNIQTDYDMANGARGVVHEIILDEREADHESSTFERKLQFPPACVLVKLERMR